MQPLKADQIRGSWATILLPMNADDSIDFGRLAAEVDTLMDARVNGVYTNGTAGEFYAQTEAEFDRIQIIVAERCEKAGIPFQIGASHMDALISLERIRRAAELKPSAIQIILPDWFPLVASEQIEFLKRAAEIADPVGLVLYNPPHAKRVLSPSQMGDLAIAIPALVGVKVPDGDENWYAEMRRSCSGLSVFVPGHHLATGISRGAQGSYSNVACLSPVGGQRWYQLMQTDLPAALALERRIQQFLSAYFTPLITQDNYANQAVDKLLAAIGGWADVGTRLRWPMRSIPLDIAEELRPFAHAALPELFEPELLLGPIH